MDLSIYREEQCKTKATTSKATLYTLDKTLSTMENKGEEIELISNIKTLEAELERHKTTYKGMTSKRDMQQRRLEDTHLELNKVLTTYKKMKGCSFYEDKFGTEFRGKYMPGLTISEGNYGEIYLGIRMKDQKKIAIKRLIKKNIEEWKKVDKKIIPKEECLWEQANRIPGVIKLLDRIEHEKSILYVMETPERGVDMKEFLKNHLLTEQEACHFFKQLVKTINTCLEKDIIHKDIKPENLMLNLDNLQIKLIDFSHGEEAHNSKYRTKPGTCLYAPPEYFENNYYYGESMTVWQLGVTLFTLLQGRVPFCNRTEIKKGEYTIIRKISIDGENLLYKCLNIYPGCRIKLSEILYHQWFDQWYE
jgi:serine/threonine protein kinase